MQFFSLIPTNSWSPYLTFYTGLLVTLSTPISCLGLICMYLLPHACIQIFLIYNKMYLMCEKIGFSTDMKNPKHPPPTFSLIKWLVSEKENNSLLEDILLHSDTLMTDS